MARTLIADDHLLLCEGLRNLLEPGHEVVAVVHDGRDVVPHALETHPDLILLDIGLPGRNGLDVARELSDALPEAAVLMLTMHPDRVYVDEALAAGARGYMLKVATGSELRFAIDEVLAGHTYVTPLVAAAPPRRRQANPLGQADEPEDAPLPGIPGAAALSARQREVLRLIAQGRTNAELAETLGITVKAVEFHRTRIKRVLGLTSNAALVRYAVGQGLGE